MSFSVGISSWIWCYSIPKLNFNVLDKNKKSEPIPYRNQVRISQVWWTVQDSNLWPHARQACALPAELTARTEQWYTTTPAMFCQHFFTRIQFFFFAEGDYLQHTLSGQECKEGKIAEIVPPFSVIFLRAPFLSFPPVFYIMFLYYVLREWGAFYDGNDWFWQR